MTDVAGLLTVCQKEVAVLDDLVMTLDQEQQAILRFDAAQMENLAQQKAAQLAVLTAARQLRLDAQTVAGLAEPAVWRTWLLQAPAELQSCWHQLETLLIKLKTLNDINAAMADERMRFATEVIESVRASNQAISGYGRDGVFHAGLSGSRKLGSA